MDRHTHLLASVLQTCTMLHPDDPKAAVEHANRILDQVELFDNERYVRPLAEDLDEELSNIQDDLLPDPGDMIPHADRSLKDWTRCNNESKYITEVWKRLEHMIKCIEELEVNVILNRNHDPYKEIMELRHSAKLLRAYHEFRNIHSDSWDAAFWTSDELNDYVNIRLNGNPDALF